MVRPCGARGFVDPGDAVLHQCIRPLIGACAPGHHGYQRACDLISGQASNGLFGSPVFASAGKTDPPSSSHPLADSAGKGPITIINRACHEDCFAYWVARLMVAFSLARALFRWKTQTVPVENQIRTYWWCSPPRMGRQRICPARSTVRENGASFSKDRCVRAPL